MAEKKAAMALIVEDEEPIRELLADTLWSEGYSTVEARDGLQAIALLDEMILPTHVPCVVVLDMMLPRASGLEVLEHLKQQAAYVPVVAMSASLPHLAAAQAAGTQATLAKPFDLNQLVAAVEQCAAPATN
ncbi:MAG TPA: response regulator [Chloroflexota bacterium]